MLRQTLITLTAVAALGVGSAAMAAHGGAGGGGHGGGGWSGMRGGSVGPVTRGGPMTTRPVGPVQSWNGPRNNLAWGMRDHHDHFHHRFHNRFFAFGFGGPFYDYAYTCWTQVPTRYGWRWVYVCGDYGY